MNRNEEYTALLSELDCLPPRLEGAVQRAEARLRRRRIGQWLGVPVGSLAVCFAAFVLLVNLCVPFAHACGSVPFLRDLAKAVAWSPSLSAAVENEYVQPIGQSQTVNDITATMEYVIVDRKRVNVFFTLNSETYPRLQAELPEIAGDAPGSVIGADFCRENGTLLQFSLDYGEESVPDHLTMTFGVSQWEDPNTVPAPETFDPRPWQEQMLDEDYGMVPQPELLAEFTFTLEFDPQFTEQGEILELDRAFRLDGQTLILTEVESYPTHLRLRFTGDPNNTEWLNDFHFYLENERGERIESISNGIYSTGDPREGGKTFYMESPFFATCEHLTLRIQRAFWLDKERDRFRVDLENETADWLPEGMELEEVRHLENGYVVTLSGQMYQEDHTYGLIEDCRHPDSGEAVPYDNMAWSNIENGRFSTYIPLKGYTDTAVDIIPAFTRVSEYAEPVSVVIK